MFSFHKPKIYRSINGCCICRAKSSSSRFTDSRRYEKDFELCFMPKEDRAGEICNACVLLVKRWKKLPNDASRRNWHHVVDARAGPGTKSILKLKNKVDEKFKKKHKHKKRARNQRPRPSPTMYSDDLSMGDDFGSDGSSHRSCSPNPSDVSDDDGSEQEAKSSRGKQPNSERSSWVSSLVDLSYWKTTEVCCGTIYKGPHGDILVDTRLFKPCGSCKGRSFSMGGATPLHNAATHDNSQFQGQDSTDNSPSISGLTLSDLGAALDLTLTEKNATLAPQRSIEMEL